MSIHWPHCRDGRCTGCIPQKGRAIDCGHSCCDERSDPFHGHFLDAATCPRCQNASRCNPPARRDTPGNTNPNNREGL